MSSEVIASAYDMEVAEVERILGQVQPRDQERVMLRVYILGGSAIYVSTNTCGS